MPYWFAYLFGGNYRGYHNGYYGSGWRPSLYRHIRKYYREGWREAGYSLTDWVFNKPKGSVCDEGGQLDQPLHLPHPAVCGVGVLGGEVSVKITSEPEYQTINVTDIDIAFPGDLQQFTLREGVDSYRDEGAILTITLGTEGHLAFNMQHAHWRAIRSRTLRVPVLSPSADATPPPSRTER